MKRSAVFCCVLPLALLFAASVQAIATTPISEFSLAAGAGPAAIAAGPDGNLWFLEVLSSRVARMTPGGRLTGEFQLPANVLLSEANPAIAAGPDGNLWFTEPAAGKVGRVTPAGVITEFAIPTANAEPVGITAGPDGNVWFTEFGVDKIGRITSAGVIQEFSLPKGSGPNSIVTGGDHNLWFTAETAGAVGRLTPTGTVTEYPVGLDPTGITLGPDGNVWFTEDFTPMIGRVMPGGAVTTFPIGHPAHAIVTGPDGQLWYVATGANMLGAFRPSDGHFAEEEIPTPTSAPVSIARGADGNIWFAEAGANKIGRAFLGCTNGPTTLCIDGTPGDHRWQLNVDYSSKTAGSGDGQAIALASLGVTQGGLFWFFGPSNPELLVKVLNGCNVNDKFWVFASATTNVGFTLTVADGVTGEVKTYTNRDGTVAVPVQDTAAFPCAVPPSLDGAPLNSAQVRAESTARLASVETELAAFRSHAAATAAAGSCVSGSATLCIDGRFQLNAHYRAGDSQNGPGVAIPLSSLGVTQGGLFWFFSADNPELLIKVVNGCAVNQHYWVFYAAATNVGFTVTATDTTTGKQRVYTNVDGTPAKPVQDTSAFACP